MSKFSELLKLYQEINSDEKEQFHKELYQTMPPEEQEQFTKEIQEEFERLFRMASATQKLCQISNALMVWEEKKTKELKAVVQKIREGTVNPAGREAAMMFLTLSVHGDWIKELATEIREFRFDSVTDVHDWLVEEVVDDAEGILESLTTLKMNAAALQPYRKQADKAKNEAILRMSDEKKSARDILNFFGDLEEETSVEAAKSNQKKVNAMNKRISILRKERSTVQQT